MASGAKFNEGAITALLNSNEKEKKEKNTVD
jgi:hypothetical protein